MEVSTLVKNRQNQTPGKMNTWLDCEAKKVNLNYVAWFG